MAQQPTNQNRPTIRDIAREVGLSDATVSRALNGHPRISAGTRARVLEVARRLNYSPNTLARALIKQRTGTVGILLPEIGYGFHYPVMLTAIENILFQWGYTAFVCHSQGDAERELLYLDMLSQRRIDGLVIAPSETGDEGQREAVREKLEIFTRQAVPVVFLDRYIPEVPGDAVLTDNALGSFLAVSHLTALGHRRIAYVSARPASSAQEARFAGYRKALAEAGVAYDPDLVATEDYHLSAAATHRLMSLPSPPTAFFCRNDAATLGVLQGLRELGLRVPQDASVIGFDPPGPGADVFLRVSYVEQPSTTLGERAAHLLLAKIKNRGESAHAATSAPASASTSASVSASAFASAQGCRFHLIPPTLIIRDSVGPVPALYRSVG